MKNKEKFAKEIVEIVINFSNIAVNKNNIPVPCAGFDCEECALYPGTDEKRCSTQLKQWAESEYVEPKMFTEEEKAFIRACDNITYLTRDQYGNLYAFAGEEKPKKYFNSWGTDGPIKASTPYYGVFLFAITSLSFSAIKWEDDEPTSREDILR